MERMAFIFIVPGNVPQSASDDLKGLKRIFTIINCLGEW